MRHILYSLLAASLMTACTQDEHTGGNLSEGRVPMVLNAGGLQVTVTPDTRGIFDGDWTDVSRIAVTETSTDEGKRTYKATPADNSTAELAPLDEANTIWWNSTDEVKTITAWHPADEAMPQVDASWTVTADQRDGIPVDEDLLYASGQVTLQNPYLTFRHLLSKVVINIRQSDYLQNYSLTDVEVTMDNICLDGKLELGIYEELILNNDGVTGTIVHPHRCDQAASGCFATYEALVMPQTVESAQKNITIQVDDVQYVWEITMLTTDVWNISFDSGCQYTFDITVDAKGLEVSVAQSTTWTDGTDGEGSVALP